MRDDKSEIAFAKFIVDVNVPVADYMIICVGVRLPRNRKLEHRSEK